MEGPGGDEEDDEVEQRGCIRPADPLGISLGLSSFEPASPSDAS